MFDQLRQAWREAVENFRRELHADAPESGSPAERLSRMRRDVADVRREATRLADEALGARREAAAEREEAGVCRRRESLARGIGDYDTARVAADFAARHEERAELLVRRADLVEAESRLLEREAGAMAAALQEIEDAIRSPGGSATADLRDLGADEPDLSEFERLEHSARERMIDARLEELKRRMR